VQRLLVLAVIGLLAELVDGSLGMAYGVTITSLLVATGLAPVLASASVHSAEVVTTMAAAVSHWRLGNTNARLISGLVLPGAVGAFCGALFLASVPGGTIKPFVSGYLLLLGFFILARFARGSRVSANEPPRRPLTRPWLALLGLVAGFFDASGGGGWGPIATTTLLARREAPPNQVIGSVDASEMVVTIAATLGFLFSMGLKGVNPWWVLALIVGGVIAAPIAAWLVRRIPTHLLGILVAGVILFTNARTLLGATGAPPAAVAPAYGALGGLWALVLAYRLATGRRTKRPTPPGGAGACDHAGPAAPADQG
jgi:hypothetical protein